jgi:hypothetical protein
MQNSCQNHPDSNFSFTILPALINLHAEKNFKFKCTILPVLINPHEEKLATLLQKNKNKIKTCNTIQFKIPRKSNQVSATDKQGMGYDSLSLN